MVSWFTSEDETPKHTTQMPGNFRPNQKHQILAAELGVDLDEAFAMFADHHASKGNKFKSWDLAFNTWLRREKQFAGNRSSSRPRPSDAQFVFKAPERAPCPVGF